MTDAGRKMTAFAEVLMVSLWAVLTVLIAHHTEHVFVAALLAGVATALYSITAAFLVEWRLS